MADPYTNGLPQVGSQTPDARHLQRLLKSRGFMPLSVQEHPNYGPQTRAAVARFYEANPDLKIGSGLNEQIGPMGWARLRGATTTTHTVVRGETLWGISNKYDVSVSELRAWNGLSGDLIHPGERLVVKRSSSDPVPPVAPPVSPSRVASPVPGHRVTYAYGIRNSRYAAGFHTGEDYAAPSGVNVVAVRSGTVAWSNGSGGAYGNWIGLRADNGRDYVYCHLSSRSVSAGQKVKAGQVLGKVGSTGNSTGPHLHFEDRPHGGGYGNVRKPTW